MKTKSIVILFAVVMLTVSVSVYAAVVFNSLTIPASVTVVPQPTTYEDVWDGPTNIAFGEILVGGSSTPKSLTIQNIDDAAHTLHLIETGLPSGCTLEFYSNSNATTVYTPVSVAAGASKVVYMVLTIGGSVAPSAKAFSVVASVS